MVARTLNHHWSYDDDNNDSDEYPNIYFLSSPCSVQIPKPSPSLTAASDCNDIGLVLDRALLRKQITQQEALVSDIRGRIEWLEDNIEWSNLGPEVRSRKDNRRNVLYEIADFQRWYDNEVSELIALNSSQCSLTSCFLHFNTTSLLMTGAIEATGEIRSTGNGTEVAVWSFNSIYVGPEVKITVVGQRAFSLVSKTTAILNTTIEVASGTIGGMPGGGSVARFNSDRFSDTPRDIYICDIGRYCDNGTVTSQMKYGLMDNETFITNNVNGIGSGNVRIYPFVITTEATDYREIQVISTSAQTGQTLSGGFKLHFKTFSTPIISYDVRTDDLKSIIEKNLNLMDPANAPVASERLTDTEAGVGEVTVSRSAQTDEEGYTWSITFSSYIGNMDQMTFTNYLTGLNASMTLVTAQDGNEISGNFTLSFQGSSTAAIDHRDLAADVQTKLLALPSVNTAFVSRIDPTENCDDGLCVNGPRAARGLTWSCYITTDVYEDNVSPTSPTHSDTFLEGERYKITADGTNLGGDGAIVNITHGLDISPNTLMAQLLLKDPFSLAYGGAGASYGGVGGSGYSDVPVGYLYNDDRLTDLLGGSGGAMRGTTPFEVNAVKGQPTGRGGAGGGAVEIVAANDIIIGSEGKIICDGSHGEQSSQGGGGGGSGGSILLGAGGTVVNYGLLSAKGGHGGFGGYEFHDMMGGGGGGGRVAYFGESVANVDGGTVSVEGGNCGAFAAPYSTNILEMNITIHTTMIGPLDDSRVYTVTAALLNESLSPVKDNQLLSFESIMSNDEYIHSYMNITVFLGIDNATTIGYNNTDNDAPYLQAIDRTLNSTFLNFTIAEVHMESYHIGNYSVGLYTREIFYYPTACDNKGSDGTFFTETLMQTAMFVAETEAAEGTGRALFFENNEATNTSSGSSREAPFPWNGPIVPFEASRYVTICLFLLSFSTFVIVLDDSSYTALHCSLLVLTLFAITTTTIIITIITIITTTINITIFSLK